MTIEAAAAAAPAALLNVDDASAAVPDDPAFDRLFGRDADGAPLWLRTDELLRIDDVDDVDENENGEKNQNEETAASDGKKKSRDAFDAEAYIAQAKKLVREKKKRRIRIGREKREKNRGLCRDRIGRSIQRGKKNSNCPKNKTLTQVPLEALSSELKDYLGTLKSKVRLQGKSGLSRASSKVSNKQKQRGIRP